jgi:hypothetical protein
MERHPVALRLDPGAARCERTAAIRLVADAEAHPARCRVRDHRFGLRDERAEVIEREREDCLAHELADSATLERLPEP